MSFTARIDRKSIPASKKMFYLSPILLEKLARLWKGSFIGTLKTYIRVPGGSLRRDMEIPLLFSELFEKNL